MGDDTVRTVVLPALLESFTAYRDGFRALTARGRNRFAARDWQGMQADTVARLEVHGRAVETARAGLRQRLGERAGQRPIWMRAKEHWAAAILGRDDRELAQTFFNSVSRRFVSRRGVDPALDFLPYDFDAPWHQPALEVAHSYPGPAVTPALVERILRDLRLAAPFRDLAGDAARVAVRLGAGLATAFHHARLDRLEVLPEPFFRNKAAYVVGRACRGAAVAPVVLALFHGPDGVEVDAVLTSEDDASIVFSFARWYFLVATDPPRALVGFLHSILPRKRIAELYISLGFHKHAKTEYYADLSRQIQTSDEQLVRAPGKEGLVMKVFTLPSFEFVFKVIKDRFPAAKRVTRREVRANYRLVLTHDRVGRLVDFQEFEDLTFPLGRFAPELRRELEAQCASQLRAEGGELVVRHLYVGRRVIPLDLFLAADLPAVDKEAAVSDWGWCLRDLAAGNVFAGDLLAKNFGVTRHGRVVFYDYDELAPLIACRFRRLPSTADDLFELAPEPWFRVAEEDVFPEEFPRFLELTGTLRDRFFAEHGCLLDPGWWQDLQQRNRSGELVDVIPYPEARRLRPR
ncbi:MAG TPA: bifunctional isocitrate dehydrogenase kinase/phosphatase [Thermoanaerobaculia bacterium]|jgi:isocitrate dehydrogenase kinase/phosphatase|nr:bifunctional isocitrate dehydrogenase kinase/phosphatase [Thermoanaerobaculia bacterium]